MVYGGSLALSVVIPLRATLARHRVQQVIHHLCRSGRGALDGVGIDFGGGGRIRMAQIARHRCQRNAIGDLQRGVCVPLRYNYDKPEKPRRIKGFEVFSLIFSSFSKPKNHTEISRIAGGVSLTTNE